LEKLFPDLDKSFYKLQKYFDMNIFPDQKSSEEIEGWNHCPCTPSTPTPVTPTPLTLDPVTPLTPIPDKTEYS